MYFLNESMYFIIMFYKCISLMKNRYLPNYNISLAKHESTTFFNFNGFETVYIRTWHLKGYVSLTHVGVLTLKALN